jgi:predicted Fe-Mo cluster-binding NifX family protein
MKIAVATVDGINVSQHFGQSVAFIVFDIEDGAIKSKQLLSGNSTPHNDGLCDGGHQAHGGIIGMLDGCNVLICGGIGAGAANAVRQLGLQPVIIPGIDAAEEAVAYFLSGKADLSTASTCSCHH